MRIAPAKILFILLPLAGCGTSNNPPRAPLFTSVPVTTAVEATPYTYKLTAISLDKSPITFALSSAPLGAILSGSSTIFWIPTHEQSRTANSFEVVASSAAGGTAKQSWKVTPNGTVTIKAVTTYWGPSGPTDVPRDWSLALELPSVLVPQLDGSFQTLEGAANPDGSFSIPNVPSGYYWLRIGFNENYWTSASDFDHGSDVSGSPPARILMSTTTLIYSISGLAPVQQGDYLAVQSNVAEDAPFGRYFPLNNPGDTTFYEANAGPTFSDWSKINTLYFEQHRLSASGSFSGWLIGPSQIFPNISFTNGCTNSVTGSLAPSPVASLSLNIKGSAWASTAQGIGAGTTTPVTSDFLAFVEPYLPVGNEPLHGPSALAPSFALLLQAEPVQSTNRFSPFYLCGEVSYDQGEFPLPDTKGPIVTDLDYGTLSYSDPFPSTWPRVFQYCQFSSVLLPRPNSTFTDTFLTINEQTIPLPTGPVTPLLTAIQNPTLNGASLFQSATINTTNVKISWDPPAVGQPYGYVLQVHQLSFNIEGQTLYVSGGVYATTQTSIQVPFLTSGTYVFEITALVDGAANMERSPLRSKIPSAKASVISGVFVITPSGSQNAISRALATKALAVITSESFDRSIQTTRSSSFAIE